MRALLAHIGLDVTFGITGHAFVGGDLLVQELIDRLFGGDDDDRISGGTSGDWLYGGHGADRMYGEGGLDRLYAGDVEGNAWTFTVPPAQDTLSGGAGDDILVSRDSFIDHLFDDRGRDSAYADEDDRLTGIESTV